MFDVKNKETKKIIDVSLFIINIEKYLVVIT